jgi:hypothetical protein
MPHEKNLNEATQRPEAIHGSSGADVLLTPPLCERLGRFDRIAASEYIS